nr:heme-binding protein [Arboricoccus pini]
MLPKERQPKKQFYGIHSSKGGLVMTSQAGIPLMSGHIVVGAVSVGSSAGKQDHQVATTGDQVF